MERVRCIMMYLLKKAISARTADIQLYQRQETKVEKLEQQNRKRLGLQQTEVVHTGARFHHWEQPVLNARTRNHLPRSTMQGNFTALLGQTHIDPLTHTATFPPPHQTIPFVPSFCPITNPVPPSHKNRFLPFF